ncbi:hypothetical protein FHS55_001575 [Angulomicrobium tetraedrale]|uniref:Winged helix domain-containing protein n=1 Tax=Ancylobacter tetraedralis TaxID=217068 RepID=A0A839Z849_9HYPH|nr:hypothetical protein [Ancylobacter tetraedralis]MBB3770980.1 hypothetical protein [Ancylobacter tetraedralis]
MRGAKALYVQARVGGEGGGERTFVGRMAWALVQLVQAGDRGITPITHPAPRTSHYILRLRQEGLAIETIEEPHSGAFSGHHARYVLRTAVTILAQGGVMAPPSAPLPAGAALPYVRGGAR